ncbi:hypothetical protein VTN02DRAFT_4594 [Thermoascus thermophilus]
MSPLVHRQQLQEDGEHHILEDHILEDKADEHQHWLGLPGFLLSEVYAAKALSEERFSEFVLRAIVSVRHDSCLATESYPSRSPCSPVPEGVEDDARLPCTHH